MRDCDGNDGHLDWRVILQGVTLGWGGGKGSWDPFLVILASACESTTTSDQTFNLKQTHTKNDKGLSLLSSKHKGSLRLPGGKGKER